MAASCSLRQCDPLVVLSESATAFVRHLLDELRGVISMSEVEILWHELGNSQ